jgi:thiamine pyrophosphokinase
MNQKIVHTTPRITLFGGGEIKKQQISRAVKLATYIVAADKGALTALRHGLVPDAVFGDMDGDAGELAKVLPADRIHRIAEQDSTDFEKCLYSIAADFVIALGVTGNRLDHSLAAFNALCKFPDMRVVILSGKDMCFLSPLTITLDLPVGTRLSLFPMGEASGSSVGLEWPIDGIKFSPMGRVGTSNQTRSAQVTLSFTRRNMLVILPAKHLGNVIQRLTKT